MAFWGKFFEGKSLPQALHCAEPDSLSSWCSQRQRLLQSLDGSDGGTWNTLITSLCTCREKGLRRLVSGSVVVVIYPSPFIIIVSIHKARILLPDIRRWGRYVLASFTYHMQKNTSAARAVSTVSSKRKLQFRWSHRARISTFNI